MKMISELKELSVSDLNSKLLQLRKEQFNMRLKKANGTLDKTHEAGNLRRNIARVKTLITEKARNNDVN